MKKATGGDGIPVELFQILRDDAVKVLLSIYQQMWKTQEWPQYLEGQFLFQWQRMLKILQARLQQYVNCELPDVQAGFRKGRGNRDQIVSIHWIIKKARVFQKNIYFCFIDYAKGFDCVDPNKLWKIVKEMGIPRPPDLPPEQSVCRSRSNI